MMDNGPHHGAALPPAPRVCVCCDRDALSGVQREFVAAGWAPRAMSDPLADARRDAAAPVLCVAQLDGGAGIAEVIDLLLRGVSVVVLVADPTLAIDVFDQCRRIATAEWFDQAQRPVTDQLSDEQVALLLAIRSGDDVEQAARRHHLSERTAARRLNDARRSLGARSTAEAVSLVGRRIDELRHTS